MLTLHPGRPFVNRQPLSHGNRETKSSARAFEARFNPEEDDFRRQVEETVRWAATRRFEAEFEAYVTRVVNRDSSERRNPKDRSVAVESCCHCGTHLCCLFYRKGHRPRNLDTPWGRLHLQVPRVECVCGGEVSLTFPQFAPSARRYEPVNEEMFLLSGLCLSLRQVQAVLDYRGVRLSISTIAGEIATVADVSGQTFTEKAQDAPPVVMLDGIWVHVAEETGKKVHDRRGVLRKQKRVRRKPVLIAWGIYPDTGKKVLLCWVVGKAEDETSWQKLLKKLSKQGVEYRNGLRLFIHDGSGGLEKAFEQITFGPVEHQRCIFHKMRNVVDAVKGDEGMTAKEKQERRNTMLSELSAIWDAPTQDEARVRCEQFAARWEEEEPAAVIKLRNGFEATTAYYLVEEAAQAQGLHWRREYLRATSLHERWNRTLRRKARSSVIFQSERGLLANAYLALGCQGKNKEGRLSEWLRAVGRSARKASAPPRKRFPH